MISKNGSFNKASGHNPFTSAFDEMVAQAIDVCKFPGLSVAVIDSDEDYIKGYGIAKFPDTYVTPETLFYAGSTTKAFCAAAVSLLVDDTENHRNIQWSTPISQLIFDDFVLQDPYWTEHTTLEDALSHRTGYSSHNKCCIGTGSTVRENVRKLRHLPASREPRMVSEYCNIMFEAVSHAIEVVKHEYLGDFLARRIWRPLGMTATYFSLNDAKVSGKPFAQGYYWDNKKGEHVLVPYLDLAEVSGAGCNISNVIDYTKWLRAIIHMSGPVSSSAYEALAKPLIPFEFAWPPSMPTVFCALGWMTLFYHGEKVVFHPGGIIGFAAMVVYLPQRKWGCVMMSNSNNAAPALEKLMWRLIDELLGVPEKERVNWEAWFKSQQQLARSRILNARERIYPHAASLAQSLPLHAYAGSYTHSAYPTLNLVVQDDVLRADVPNPWPFEIIFEHVSGEYFLARIAKFAVEMDEIVAAEFAINVKGEVERLRVRFEQDCEMIEFVRV